MVPLRRDPWSFADVTLAPSTTALPGSAALQQIANGIASWALIGALIALLLGAALWAIGSHTQNMHQSRPGRRAVVTSLVAAVLIGAAPSLINFFFNTGLSRPLVSTFLCLFSPVTCAATTLGKATIGDLFDALTGWIVASVQWLLEGGWVGTDLGERPGDGGARGRAGVQRPARRSRPS